MVAAEIEPDVTAPIPLLPPVINAILRLSMGGSLDADDLAMIVEINGNGPEPVRPVDPCITGERRGFVGRRLAKGDPYPFP